MNAEELERDIRFEPLREGIQLARTAGASSLEIMEEFKSSLGKTEFTRCIELMKNAKLEEAGVVRKRKHYSPAFKQKMYDRQGGACPWCPKPLDIPARRNEVDHINANLPDPEREQRSNLCLAHKSCNASKNAKSIYELAKSTGMTVTEILSKGDHSEEVEEAIEHNLEA